MKKVSKKIQSLVRVQVTIQVGFFRQVTDSGLCRDVPWRMTEHFNVPFGRVKQAKQQLDGCGFTRAVRSEQTKHFSLAHFKIDVVDRPGFGTSPEILEDLS